MSLVAWTDERVDHLKRLWAAGLSATQCAAELSGPPYTTLPHISRNAAIGKVHRLGLSGRSKLPDAPKPRERNVRPVQQKMRVSRPAGHNLKAASLVPGDAADGIEQEFEGGVEIPPATDACTLLELSDSVCRWPIGDPQKPDFHFCGGATAAPPYCPAHAHFAYQAPAARQRQVTVSSAERARRIIQGQLADQAARRAAT